MTDSTVTEVLEVEIPTSHVVNYGFISGSPVDPTKTRYVPLEEHHRAALAMPGIKTLNADGSITVTPPPPPPLRFSTQQPITPPPVSTTDATPKEIYRLTLAVQTGYVGDLLLIGVDRGNGNIRVLQASFAVKRLNGGAIGVGTPALIVTPRQTDAGVTWTASATLSGNDAIVQVIGAAGRTIDWNLTGDLTSFTPAGV
jgi:hypothetical protein